MSWMVNELGLSQGENELAAASNACQHGCMNTNLRWIIHVDMDAFYASIEQMDYPELQGSPVIVGGTGPRAVVSAASYEARRFGVHSAMPMLTALQRCPHAVQRPVRMERYKAVSRSIMARLHQYSPRVEQASVDEVYLDATGLERVFGPVELLGRQIKADVLRVTGGLTCSIGIAPVKFLAKIVSDLKKPDGLAVLNPEDMPAFLHGLPVERIPGVGRSFLASLHSLGIYRTKDVLRYSPEFWERRFGKAGLQLLDRSKGIDPRNVEPFVPPRSESAETTFATDTGDRDILRQWLYRHADRVGRSLRRQHISGRVVTMKIKYSDFRQTSRQLTLPFPTCATQTIYEAGCALLDAMELDAQVRLIGIGVSGFDPAPQQFSIPLGVTPEKRERRRVRLDRVLDSLAERFGADTITRGSLFRPGTDRKKR